MIRKIVTFYSLLSMVCSLEFGLKQELEQIFAPADATTGFLNDKLVSQQEVFQKAKKAVFNLVYSDDDRQQQNVTAFAAENSGNGKVYFMTVAHIFIAPTTRKDRNFRFKYRESKNLLNFTVWDWQERNVINGTDCKPVQSGMFPFISDDDYIIFECEMKRSDTLEISFKSCKFPAANTDEWLFAIGASDAHQIEETPDFLYGWNPETRTFSTKDQTAASLVGYPVVKASRLYNGEVLIGLYGMVTGELDADEQETCMKRQSSSGVNDCSHVGMVLSIGKICECVFMMGCREKGIE